MSARIVVNLAHGLAECALERGPDCGTWLSLSQGPEVVVVKLSTPGLDALRLALAREPETPTTPDAMAAAAASGAETPVSAEYR